MLFGPVSGTATDGDRDHYCVSSQHRLVCAPCVKIAAVFGLICVFLAALGFI